MSTLKTIEVGIRKEGHPIGVMLHGFGSCVEHIAPLCNVFLESIPYWLVLQAPIPLNLLGSPDPGYAWFPKQYDGLPNEPIVSWHDLENYDLPEIVEAAHFVEETLKEKDAFSSKVVLVGFSQGGMIASEVALQRACTSHKNNEETNTFTALVLLASAFLAQERRTALVEELTTSNTIELPSVLVCHGKRDEVLLPQQGRAQYEFWKNHAPHADFYEFGGGHEASDEVCEYMAAFLHKALHS